MEKYNIIPMGDNCIIAEVLKDLGIRKCSYPFDWITHVNYFKATNISYNFEIVEKLMQDNFNINDFLGNAFTNGTKIYNNIWFPHDNEENKEETMNKYKRRFERLREDIANKKNIFIFLTRHYVIKEPAFDKIVEQILSYNKDNKIIYIYGSAHDYMHKQKYKVSVAYQYLFYDVKKLTRDMKYDYEYYRPVVKTYISELFAKLKEGERN